MKFLKIAKVAYQEIHSGRLNQAVDRCTDGSSTNSLGGRFLTNFLTRLLWMCYEHTESFDGSPIWGSQLESNYWTN